MATKGAQHRPPRFDAGVLGNARAPIGGENYASFAFSPVFFIVFNAIFGALIIPK